MYAIRSYYGPGCGRPLLSVYRHGQLQRQGRIKIKGISSISIPVITSYSIHYTKLYEGTAYSGIFTNREALNPVLIEAGKDSGERVWPFPMDEDYDKLLESNIADIKQCSRESGMDHISYNFV